MKLLNETPTPEELEIYEAFQEWMASYDGGDIEGIMKWMAPDVLSVGTGRDEISRSSDAIREGFSRDFGELDELRLIDGFVTVKARGDAGWLFFQAVYGVNVKGEPIRYETRRTVVFRKIEGRWIQEHLHHSIPDRTQSDHRSFPVGPITAGRYSILFTSSRDAIIMVSRWDRSILEANMAALGMYGLSEERMLNSRLDDLMDDDELTAFLRRVNSSPKEGGLFQAVHRGPSGPFPVEISVRITELEGRSIVVMVVRDSTSRVETERALRRSEERLRLAMEANEDGLWELDVPTMTMYVSGSSWGGSGNVEERFPYRAWREMAHRDDRDDIDKALTGHLDRGDEYRVEYRMDRGDGRWRWVLERGRVVDRRSDGSSLRMIGTIMDVDRRKRIEEERLELTKKLEKMASIDKLTGILNRQRFESLLQEKMDRRRLPLCLIMFDLDRFKDLNDARGHLEGDRALVLASEAVSGRLRVGDLFGRWGGDEFMVALEQDLDKSLIVAEDLRKRICDALGDGFQGVTASFGLALWNGKASLENLSNMADEALYRAKKDGRNRVVVFDDAGYN